ncbi:hypothetical protein [Ruania alba]|uniref:hypothetical protein n=1 Tax=Ruania alba TaxID=648782 RepID=UPI001587AC8B|nr:hypothetical protein [Ruania alba]
MPDESGASGSSGTESVGGAPSESARSRPPSLYEYAPSGTLDSPAQSPYVAVPASSATGAGPAEAAPPPQPPRRTGLIIGVGAVSLVAVVLVVLLAVNLITGGGDPGPTATPTPTTTEPTDDPSPEPTDDPSPEPTDTPDPEPTDTPDSDGPVPTDGYTVLTGDEPAIVNDYDGEPQVEVRLLAVERQWESDRDYVCQDATGEQIAVQLEFTVISDARPYYTFYGSELGLVDTAGHKIADVRGDSFCFDEEDRAPGDLRPDEVVTGWAVLEAPREPGAILWEDRYTYPEPPPYVWLLADY